MSVSRRCFLKFFGGASVGAVLSPLPWKLLDDVSIWTQNGTWVEHPARGPVSHLYSTCTQCPSGCGLRLRRVGERTVSAWGIPGHPLGSGRLCPAGLGTAQIPFHPARLRGAAIRSMGEGGSWQPVEVSDIAREVGRKLTRSGTGGGGEAMAVLDFRPGRSLSVLYREFADTAGGRYLVHSDGREQSSKTMSELFPLSGATHGLDLARAGAVISFGAPLLDAWSGGGPAEGLLPAADSSEKTRKPFILQVQTNGSMNAGLADSWLPIKPGTEAEFALGLAFITRHELGSTAAHRDLEQNLRTHVDPILLKHTPEMVASVTGVSARVMRDTARDIRHHGQAVAVGCGDPGAGPLGPRAERAIGILNLVLGSVGREGGLLPRPTTDTLFDETQTVFTELADVPDGSLDLLIVDGSLPGSPVPHGLLRKKMRDKKSRIVALSPFGTGPSAEADYLIPTAAPGEWDDDVSSRALAPEAFYSIARGVQEAPPWTVHPADALGMLADAGGLDSPSRFTRAGHRAVLDRRIARLHARGTGHVFDPANDTTHDLARIGSSGDLKKILARGGCWYEAAQADPSSPIMRLAENDVPLEARLVEAAGKPLPAAETASYPLTVMPQGPAVAAGSGVLPTVVNKLYRESHLLPDAGTARVNPATARRQGLRPGHPARLKTRHGELAVIVRLDEKVMPDVVAVAIAPAPENLGDPAGGPDDIVQTNILEVCGALTNSVWRVERASLQEL